VKKLFRHRHKQYFHFESVFGIGIFATKQHSHGIY